MLKKTIAFIVGLIGCLLLIALPLFLTKRAQFRKMGESKEQQQQHVPPTTVTASAIQEESWENTLTATGSVAAVQGVTVAAEMGGKVQKIAFEPGAMVKQGDVLVQLDTSTEEAQLRAADATAALSKANLERAKELRQSNTNSPAELDAAEAQAKQAQAQADSIRAIVAKKTVRAPFAGRLGLRLVNLGQILHESDPITTLQTLDPIFVNFALPQQRLPLIQTGHAVRISSDAAPGKPLEGTITAISPEVDPATRSLRVQATISNAEEKLRAGMFVNVEVVLPTSTKVLAIPATAVLYAPYGDSVFVVDEKKGADGKVEKVLRQQFIRLGTTRGDFVSVVDGLKPGETVVTSGVFKLRAGTAVVIDNKLAPPAKLDPQPPNA